MRASVLANIYQKRYQLNKEISYLESAILGLFGILGIPSLSILYLHHLPFMSWPVLAIGLIQVFLYAYMAVDALYQMIAKSIACKLIKIERKPDRQLEHKSLEKEIVGSLLVNKIFNR